MGSMSRCLESENSSSRLGLRRQTMATRCESAVEWDKGEDKELIWSDCSLPLMHWQKERKKERATPLGVTLAEIDLS